MITDNDFKNDTNKIIKDKTVSQKTITKKCKIIYKNDVK